MSSLEIKIGEWRICLPPSWGRLDEQTFFRSQALLGQLQISAAKHLHGPKPAVDAFALRESLFQVAKSHGFSRPRNLQESRTKHVAVVCGDLDSNGAYVGRMWFLSYEDGLLFATYLSPVGSNPSIDEEIAEAHEALLGAQVVTQQ